MTKEKKKSIRTWQKKKKKKTKYLPALLALQTKFHQDLVFANSNQFQNFAENNFITGDEFK